MPALSRKRLSCKRRIRPVWALAAILAWPAIARAAETCTTQSQMPASDRVALTATAQSFAARVQANDAAGLKALTIPQYAQNFDGIAAAIQTTAPKIAADTLTVTSLYLLEVTESTHTAASTVTADTQFFCTLSTSAEVSFTFPHLLPNRYAFVTVRAQGTQTAWQLSFVLQQTSKDWQLAGFYPRAAMAAGHDGLWYWTQARLYTKQNQHWNAWLYYSVADALLTPVEFVSSTNRSKLQAEQTDAMPQPLQANGISPQHPLTAGGFDFTAIGTQPSQDGKSLELALHITATDVSDPVAVRARGLQAIEALFTAYPEFGSAFTSAWVYADAPGQSSFAIEFNPISIPLPQANVHD